MNDTIQLIFVKCKKPQITKLYESAFPKCERRETSEFWKNIATLPNLECFEVKYCDNFAGFLTMWNLDAFFYIEYFAISGRLRGQQIGRRALQKVLTDCKKSVILEVEPFHDVASRRRIAFYESVGFVLDDNMYMQPLYRCDETPVQLRLMEYGGNLLPSQFEFVKTIIYSQIYNVTIS